VEERGVPGQVPGVHPGTLGDEVLDAAQEVWKG